MLTNSQYTQNQVRILQRQRIQTYNEHW